MVGKYVGIRCRRTVHAYLSGNHVARDVDAIDWGRTSDIDLIKMFYRMEEKSSAIKRWNYDFATSNPGLTIRMTKVAIFPRTKLGNRFRNALIEHLRDMMNSEEFA